MTLAPWERVLPDAGCSRPTTAAHFLCLPGERFGFFPGPRTFPTAHLAAAIAFLAAPSDLPITFGTVHVVDGGGDSGGEVAGGGVGGADAIDTR